MTFHKLSVAIALIATAAVASADAKSTLQKLCKEFDQAMMTKDAKWFERTAAADYHEVGMSGKKYDRKTAMTMMKEMFKMGSVDSISTKVLTASQKENRMVATFNSKMTGHFKMDPKATKPSVMKCDNQFAQVWKKVGGEWKLSENKILKSNTTVDGKPFNMGG